MTQPSLFGYNPEEHARGTDPGTSHQSARQVTTISSDCGALLRAYGRKPLGLTAEQAAENARISPWAASKRNSDLRRMGFIEPVIADGVTVTRANHSGRKADVCMITVAGRNKLAELKLAEMTVL